MASTPCSSQASASATQSSQVTPSWPSIMSARRTAVKPTYPRRIVDELILAELRCAPAHGYALSNALERRGSSAARSSVHRALRRLERDGLVSGTWQDGRHRRVYRLTPAGAEALRVRALEVRSSTRR